jgi:adenosylcobinamide kinase / adenosylcobinamide-phosphate guanylyltransferase
MAFLVMGTRKKCVTLVLGGARSGKSRYAQQIASRFERITFIATARPSDPEMRRKISQHRRERPCKWRTIEAPLNLGNAIDLESRHADMVLVDCLTVFVANFMSARNGARKDTRKDIEQVLSAIRMSKASILVVSNEVGSGVVPSYRSGRIFRDLLGQLNQQVAEIADKVVVMVAGVAVTVKDTTAS